MKRERRENIKGKRKAWATRGTDGKFKNWTGKGRSLKQDRRVKSPTKAKPGQGHRGDHKVMKGRRAQNSKPEFNFFGVVNDFVKWKW